MRARVGSWGVAASVVAFAAGCSDYFGKTKENVPGEPLGVYEIQAHADLESTCIELINATPRPWSFEVQLRREGIKGYWLSGASPIQGTIDGKGGLAFKQTMRVVVREKADKARELGPCAILRTDEFVGALAGSPSTEDGLASFTGTLRYSYQVEKGSDCRDVIGLPEPGREEPLFSTLPCDARFAVTATRVPDES